MKMFASTVTGALTILGLFCLSSAGPTLVDLSPRCGTTLTPTFLQKVREAYPHEIQSSTISDGYHFRVSQSVDANGNIYKRIYQIVAFENIPVGSYGCQLAVTFPPNYPIISTGVPTLNITTLFNGESSSIRYPNTISWSSLNPPTSPPLGQGLFGTITLTPGTTQVINSEACPVDGENLAFLFSIAAWETQPASVAYHQDLILFGAEFAGVYLTYDC